MKSLLWLFSIAGILAIVSIIFGIEYRSMHPYYAGMISNLDHRNIIIAGLIFACIPVWYLLYAKQKSYLWLFVAYTIALILFAITFLRIKDSLLWGSLKLMLNIFFFTTLIFAFIAILTVAWDYIKHKVLALDTKDIVDVAMSFWVWLWSLLLVWYILIALWLFFPLVTRCVFLAAATTLYFQRDRSANIWSIISSSTDITNCSSSIKSFITILSLCSVLYLFLWFLLSFIPYPTAWDANHAYMFFPKFFAQNNGYFWDNTAMAPWLQLWYVYISYRFSLFQPFGWSIGISSDTIAIVMNHLSGFFVLVLWLIWTKSFVSFVTTKLRINSDMYDSWSIIIMRIILLLRLTSGMGAFLIFVDNKTDLWVMSLVVLALLSAFRFLKQLLWSSQDFNWKYMLLSAFFFALAALAKPTGMFDVVSFMTLFVALYFWSLATISTSLWVIWLLSVLQIMSIKEFFTPEQWFILLILSALWLAYSFLTQRDKVLLYLRPMVLWIISFLCIFVVFRWPFVLVSNIVYDRSVAPSDVVKQILFSRNTIHRDQLSTPLYAQLTSWPSVCSLASEWLSSTKDLYAELNTIPWSSYNEDFGRYVGFGWKGNESDQKRKVNPFILPSFFWFVDDGCYNIDVSHNFSNDAVSLCNFRTKRKSLDIPVLEQILSLVTPNSEVYKQILLLITERKKNIAADQVSIDQIETIRALDKYMQDGSILIDTNSAWVRNLYIPYKYLIFANINFNWSLQNLSSYYTDIWFIRLVILVLHIIWCIYAVSRKHHFMLQMHIVTIFAWFIWMLVWSAIIRYNTGLFVWSWLATVLFFIQLLHDHKGDTYRTGFLMMWWVFVLVALVHGVFNFTRISSQWWWGPFMRYKSNFGRLPLVNDNGQMVEFAQKWFGFDELFNLQFPHYTTSIAAINQRRSSDAVVIAWTYLQYFLADQSNISTDNFLTTFWETISDNNVCRSFLRMQDKKIKYYVIDQNIASVVQWEGNKSLYDRFFWVISPDGSSIQSYGAMTMIAAMVEQWYMELVSTNNIWTKYALTLPKSSFSWMTDEQVTITRARMLAARFFWQQIVQQIIEIALQKFNQNDFIQDIADMTGKIIREDVLKSLLSKWVIDHSLIRELSGDERIVLGQYMQLQQLASQDKAQLKAQIQNMIIQSLQSSSQLLTLKLLY
jgi:hypothetical protein